VLFRTHLSGAIFVQTLMSDILPEIDRNLLTGHNSSYKTKERVLQ
jgi:hypothetical protein